MKTALHGAPWLHAMARIFDRNGAELYLVGGAVRNPLMGLPLSDIDVCGPERPETVCAFCEGTEIRAHLRAAHFGTVELHITDENGQRHMAEYTTWREDSYRCGHRPDSVKFTKDIRVDADRRDFSVNALYRRVHEDGLEDVIDPTGGIDHMKQGVLHTVSENPDRVLGEDGLRILRAARFQAELDLQPTPALLESLKKNAPLLAEIACERLRDELQKTLMADLRYPMLKRRFPATYSGLSTIAGIGAWPHLFGETAFDEEAANALSRLSVPALSARMALLLRKADTAVVEKALQRMRFSAKETAETLLHLQALQTVQTADLFTLAKAGRHALTTVCACFAALGDAAGQAAAETALRKLEGKPMSLKELAVNGADLIPLFKAQNRPMKDMGGVLENLWKAVVEGRAANERSALLQLVSNGV